MNLSIIGYHFLLQEQFGEIWVPSAVLQELRLGDRFPGWKNIQDGLDAGWIRVQKVDDEAFVQVLREDLDIGEAEAIALALQIKADRVLLDERDGRRVARLSGLKTTGVLGILLQAKYEHHLREKFEQINTRRRCAVNDRLGQLGVAEKAIWTLS